MNVVSRKLPGLHKSSAGVFRIRAGGAAESARAAPAVSVEGTAPSGTMALVAAVAAVWAWAGATAAVPLVRRGTAAPRETVQAAAPGGEILFGGHAAQTWRAGILANRPEVQTAGQR